MAKVIFRVYIDGKLRGEPRTMDTNEVELLLREIALLRDEPHMIEFEFPDAPPDDRFLRIGTDPRGMVDAIAMDMEISDRKFDEEN